MVFSLVNISDTVIGQTKNIHQQSNVYSECCILMIFDEWLAKLIYQTNTTRIHGRYIYTVDEGILPTGSLRLLWKKKTLFSGSI